MQIKGFVTWQRSTRYLSNKKQESRIRDCENPETIFRRLKWLQKAFAVLVYYKKKHSVSFTECNRVVPDDVRMRFMNPLKKRLFPLVAVTLSSAFVPVSFSFFLVPFFPRARLRGWVEWKGGRLVSPGPPSTRSPGHRSDHWTLGTFHVPFRVGLVLSSLLFCLLE